jgi:hypothetical protein
MSERSHSQVKGQYTAEFRQEESQTDPNWRQKCGPVLDYGEHNDNKD